MPVNSSQPIPAGSQKPVPIPPGKKLIWIENLDNADGSVTFDLDGAIHSLNYFNNQVHPGQAYDFTAATKNYDFFNNPPPALGHPSSDVRVHVLSND